MIKKIVCIVLFLSLLFGLSWFIILKGSIFSVPNSTSNVSSKLAVTSSVNVDWQWLHQLQQPLSLLLLQIILVLLVSRIFAFLFSKIGQPAVIGEMIAGIVLGISVFGAIVPSLFSFVFPPSSFNNLELLSKLGLAFFMFIIGMEFEIEEMKHKTKTVFFISLMSMMIPFFLGIVLAYFIYPIFVMPHISFFCFALFMGISLSITAFPILARIVKERGMVKTPLGNLVLSCAATVDLMAWCLLALIIAFTHDTSIFKGMFTLFCALLFISFMLLLVRPLLTWIIIKFSTISFNDKRIILLAFIVLLFSALIAEIIGIHLLFGAFIAGLVIPNNKILKESLTAKLEDISVVLFLPIFFAFNGLRLHIGLIHSAYMWFICVIIIIVGIVGKFIGSAIPARLSGQSWKNSFSIGVFMNTRGLMELVVLNIGYELGILSQTLFAILILMAIFTTMLTSPLLNLIEYFYRKRYPIKFK